MSIQAMAWVIEASTMRGSAFAVLLMVANHEGDHDGHVCSWPSIDRLSRQSRVSRRTVINALETAAAAGELLIARNAGPKGTNLYHVNPQAGGCRFCTGAIQVLDLHPNHKEPGLGSTVVAVATDLRSKKDLKPPAAKAAVSKERKDRWNHILEKAWGRGWTQHGHGALSWGWVMHCVKKYGPDVVDSAISDVALAESPPDLGSAPYFESICVRYQAERGAA